MISKVSTLVIGLFVAVIATAEVGGTHVGGDLIRAADGRNRFCAEERDTRFGGTAYRLGNARASLENGRMYLDVTFERLRCAKTATGFAWETIPLDQPISYQVVNGDKVQNVTLFQRDPHLILVSSSYDLLDSEPLHGGSGVNRGGVEDVRLGAFLKEILGSDGYRELETRGEAIFRIELALRSTVSYSVDNGPEVVHGLVAGGRFVFMGRAQLHGGKLSVQLSPR